MPKIRPDFDDFEPARLKPMGSTKKKFVDRPDLANDGKRLSRKSRFKLLRGEGRDLMDFLKKLWPVIPERQDLQLQEDEIISPKIFRQAVEQSVRAYNEDIRIIDHRNLGALAHKIGYCGAVIEASNSEAVLGEYLKMLEKSLPRIKEINAQSLSHIIYGFAHIPANLVPKSLFVSLAHQLERCTNDCCVQDYTMAFYGLAKQDPDNSKVLWDKLKAQLLADKQELGIVCIATILHALGDRSPDENIDLVQFLTPCFEREQGELEVQHIAMSLAGLIGFDYKYSKPFFDGSLPCLQKAESLSARSFASIAYSLKPLDSNAAKPFQEVLLRHSEVVKQLNPQQLAMCFYGLHDKSSDEVYRLIRPLMERFKQIEEFNLLNLANICYGLNAVMSIENSKIFQLIADHLVACREGFNERELCMIFHGISEKQPQVVAAIVKILQPHVELQKASIDIYSIATILHGLSDNDSTEAQSIRSSLIEEIERRYRRSPEQFRQEKNISVLLTALRDTNPEFLPKLFEIFDRFKDLVLDGCNAITYSTLLSALRRLAWDHPLHEMILASLEKNLTGSDEDLETVFRELNYLDHFALQPRKHLGKLGLLIEALGAKLKNHKSGFASNFEIILQRELKSHSLLAGKTIEVNKFIDGVELDAYIPELKLNIELDGPQHRLPYRKVEDDLRDKFLLEKHGIQTRRIPMDIGINVGGELNKLLLSFC